MLIVRCRLRSDIGTANLLYRFMNHAMRVIPDLRVWLAAERRRSGAERKAKDGAGVVAAAEACLGAAEQSNEGVKLVAHSRQQLAVLGNVPSVARRREDLLVRLDHAEPIPTQHTGQIYSRQRKFNGVNLIEFCK